MLMFPLLSLAQSEWELPEVARQAVVNQEKAEKEKAKKEKKEKKAKAKSEARADNPIIVEQTSETVIEETPQKVKEEKVKPAKVREMKIDEKYRAGAVPEVDGEVVWERTIKANGHSAEELYQFVLKYVTEEVKVEGQLPESTVSLVNKREHIIAAHFEEWLVFKESMLSLDRTRFIYTTIATCKDGEVTYKLFRISYKYDSFSKEQSMFKAEEFITDKESLSKDQTRMYPIQGKFRKKTIDRVDEIYEKLTNAIMRM